MAGLPSHVAASIEAEEEAGVRGTVSPIALGAYRYPKKLANGTSVMFDVDVFALAVTEELAVWKESAERERRWFSVAEAAAAVEEDDLGGIIRAFGVIARGWE